MRDDILTYREMCDSEDVQTLQRGMNYRLNTRYSVILMSQRSNAPYKDEILADGRTIIYEGHDIPRTSRISDPKKLDQEYHTRNSGFTQNGKFAECVKSLKRGECSAEIIKVYEKLFAGVWSFRGSFELVNYSYEMSGIRKVFRFRLELLDEYATPKESSGLKPRSRIIPTNVKKDVWVRDGGQCVICGAKDELHFDHDIPYSKGGASITAENVKILCARHNLEKHDKIE